jgi:hypothetical protein
VVGPWNKASAIVQAWYNSNKGVFGVADILSGKVNPLGKLSQSWLKRIGACPAFWGFESEDGQYRYNNDVFVSYRGVDMRRIVVECPFGYGLPYATFVIRECLNRLRSASFGGRRQHISGCHLRSHTGICCAYRAFSSNAAKERAQRLYEDPCVIFWRYRSSRQYARETYCKRLG